MPDPIRFRMGSCINRAAEPGARSDAGPIRSVASSSTVLLFYFLSLAYRAGFRIIAPGQSRVAAICRQHASRRADDLSQLRIHRLATSSGVTHRPHIRGAPAVRIGGVMGILVAQNWRRGGLLGLSYGTPPEISIPAKPDYRCPEMKKALKNQGLE